MAYPRAQHNLVLLPTGFYIGLHWGVPGVAWAWAIGFPISVAPGFVDNPPTTSRQTLLESLDTTAEFVGVGVERLDYTKAIEILKRSGKKFDYAPEWLDRAPASISSIFFPPQSSDS